MPETSVLSLLDGVVMNHSFDVDIAKEYGMLEAVLISNILYWVTKNEANGKHFYDGKYWTYNSSSAFQKLFPYASKRQIEYALKKLKDEGVIETGCYNKDPRDRTTWYTFTDKFVKCKLQNCDMQTTTVWDADDNGVTPLPVINSYENSYVNDISIVGQEKIPYNDIIIYLNQAAGTNYKPSSRKTRELIQARFNEGFTADDFKVVIDKKCREWMKDPKYSKYLRPETLFGTKFESYLNQPMRELTTSDLMDQFDYSDW